MIDYMQPDFTVRPGLTAPPRVYRRDSSVFAHVDVSIITPYFNTGEVFVETFASLQAQSLQNWEWVIVDDGSTDEASITQLDRIAAKDERIKVVRQINAGPGAARNNAFRNSSGRYICLLDSDDLLEPTYLEKCVWFLESNEEFAFCNTYTVTFGSQEYLWTTGFERGKDHLQANSGPLNAVIRRDAYKDCGGFDESIRLGHEDWDFWLAMAKAGHWGYTIHEFLQWYRKNSDGRFAQVMRSGNVNKEFEKMMRHKYEGLDQHFPEPVRRCQLPFEPIETHSPVVNPMAPNPTGRRIMFIVPWMTTGGADRVNLDLIEGLTARGHDVTICATLPADHRWEHQFSRFTPDIFVLPNFLHASDYPRFLAYMIRSRKIDTVVISNSTIGYQLLPYLRSVSPEVVFVDLCHAEEPQWLNGGHPRFGVGYQDLLELNIVTTGHLAKWMENHGADIGRIRVIYTGVRVSTGQRDEVRRSVRSELNIPEGIPVIVFVGRICEQKRPALLADILRSARDQGLAFRALIIGEGELKAQLKDLMNQYHMDDTVQMLDSVSHQRWLDILVASDIFLLPSQYEGISIALLESMATGVVPIVAKVGGHDEIVKPDTGMLIPHGDNERQEYVDAIRRLLSDPAKLQQMSEQCKAFAASSLSWKGMIDDFLALLDEANQLRINHPRYPISPGFARELASLSLEYKRLGEAVDWLWTAKPNAGISSDTALLITLPGGRKIARLTTLLDQTWLGRMIIRKRVQGVTRLTMLFLSRTWLGHKMIHSRFLRSMGRRILTRFGD